MCAALVAGGHNVTRAVAHLKGLLLGKRSLVTTVRVAAMGGAVGWRGCDHGVFVGVHERFLHRGVVHISLAIYRLLHIEDGFLLRRRSHAEVDLGGYLRSCLFTGTIFDGDLLALLVD